MAQCDSSEVQYCTKGSDWPEYDEITTTCYNSQKQILRVDYAYIPENSYHNNDSTVYSYDSLSDLILITFSSHINPERIIYSYYPGHLVQSYTYQKMYNSIWYDQQKINYFYYPNQLLQQIIRLGSSWSSTTQPLTDTLVETYYYDASGNDTLTLKRGQVASPYGWEKKKFSFSNNKLIYGFDESWTQNYDSLLSFSKDTFIYNSAGYVKDAYLEYATDYLTGYHVINEYQNDSLLVHTLELTAPDEWDYEFYYSYNSSGLLAYQSNTCYICGVLTGAYTYDVYEDLVTANYTGNTFSGEFPEFSDCQYYHYAINGPSIICDSASIVLSVSEGEYYLWNTGATTQSIVADTAGIYQCSITLWDGRTYKTAPKKIISGTSHIFPVTNTLNTPSCSNLPLHLQVNFIPKTQYEWFKNDTAISSQYSFYGVNHLYISAGLYKNGSYYAVAKNYCGVDTSSVFIVTQKQARPAHITAQGPIYFCEGGGVTLISNPAVSYIWQPGYKTTQQINATQSGKYLLLAFDTNGCYSTDTLSVVAAHSPSVTPTISRAYNYLTAQTYYNPCQWYLNGLAIPGAVNYTYTPTQNGSYRVEFVSAISSCSKMSAAYNYVASTLQIDIGGPQLKVCSRDKTLTEIGLAYAPTTGVPNYTYQWNPASMVATPNLSKTKFNSNASNGWYVLTVTDGIGQVSKDSVLVTIKTTSPPPSIIPLDSVYCVHGMNQRIKTNYTNAIQYHWINTIDTTAIRYGATTYVDGNDTMKVRVIDSNYCMTGYSLPFVVTAKDTSKYYPLKIYLNGATVNCGGSGITLSTDSLPGYSYYWRDNSNNIIPNSNTTSLTLSPPYSNYYYLLGTDSNGCLSGSYGYHLDTTQMGITIQSPLGNSFCKIDSVPLIVDYNPNYTYHWSGFPALDTNVIYAKNFWTYAVQVTQPNGCHGEANFIVRYSGKPKVTILVKKPNLYAFSYDKITSYQWCFDSIPVSGGDSLYFPLTSHGLYSVITTNTAGCLDTTYFNFKCAVSVSPTAAATCVDSCAAKIYATPLGMPPFAYTWNTTPVLKFVNQVCPGNYTMQLTDYYGCVIRDSLHLNNPIPNVQIDSILNPSCLNCSDGSIHYSSHAQLAFAVIQPLQDSSYTGVFSNLSANSYVICLTSVEGCTTCDTVILAYPLAVELTKKSEQAFVLYPNPFKDEIVLDNFEEKEMQLELFSSDGRSLIKLDYTKNKTIKLFTAAISAGFYQLKITDKQSGAITYSKLIKQK